LVVGDTGGSSRQRVLIFGTSEGCISVRSKSVKVLF